jgi:hypothetical protein
MLAALIAGGRSQREIAAHLGVSQTTVRYWLGRFGLRTNARSPAPIDGCEIGEAELECPIHGLTPFVITANRRRCKLCRQEQVSRRRRRMKQLLVEEAGGACLLCGYDRCVAALQFHHVDPSTKEFALAMFGLSRSLQRMRAEAAKCVLLCGNCHAEVEAGVTMLPRSSAG